MPAETNPPDLMPAKPSQRSYRALATAIAVGIAAGGVGHATAKGLSESPTPTIRQALDLRPLRIEPNDDQTVPHRPVESLTVEPVAIIGEGDEQWLELRVESEPHADDSPLGARYAISWFVRDGQGNVAIPDAPSVHPVSPDAPQVVERILVPLNLSDGYYCLETTIMAANEQNQPIWSAGGFAYFRIDLDQLLIVDPEDWVWESSGFEERG
jgi:hypothetical protein